MWDRILMYIENVLYVLLSALIILTLVLLVQGCSSTGGAPGGSMSYSKACNAQGGVLYKGPMDRDYQCVDADNVRDMMRSL
jgi:hypothetical protein